MMAEKNNRLNFLRPRARILRTFGDELISSETVAVIELVKNAYDADATSVVVRFCEPLSIGSGSIEVIDNGHGMDIDTIRTTWMEPATLMRKRETRSRLKHRRVLGEKGIGRFASSRLANSLELISRTLSDEKEVYCYFDWTQFDDEDKYLDEIEILVEEREPEGICDGGAIEILNNYSASKKRAKTNHGTILRMTGLRINWGLTQLSSLRNGLSKLISPSLNGEQCPLVSDFQIFLDLPEEYSELSGIVEAPEVFKRPHYVISGNIDEYGKYELQIKLPDKAGPETIKGQSRLDNNRRPSCGPLRVELRVWDRDIQSLRILARNANVTVGKIRKDLDEGSGISIYRDGFRVLPYGEPHNDWLRLDLRRVQNPTLRLSNNQILGYIFISADTNPDLKDQSNREGLMAGQALNDLQEMIIFVLNEIERRRYTIRPRKIEVQHERGLFAKLELTSAEEYIRNKYPDDKKLALLISGTARELDTRLLRFQDVISRYSRLVTLGELIDTVIHDISSPLGKIVNTANQGIMYLYSVLKENLDSQHVLRNFRDIADQSDVIQIVVRKIEPFGGRRRGRPRELILEKIISDAFSVLDGDIKKCNAQISLLTTQTTVTLDPAEIQVVIINLLRNSLYWLYKVDENERKIKVTVKKGNEGELKIEFSDSGLGIEDDIRPYIFDPYFTTKPDGVGIGLTIAGEIVTDFYDGSIELLEEGSLSGANFLITLRRRV